MPNNIYHKRNANSGVVPTAAQLTVGEIALNTADGKAYTRTTAGTVVELTEASVADGGEQFTPLNVPNLALWLDSSDANSLYTTDAGPVTAVSAPTEIAGCVGWWDGDDASTFTLSGSIVSEWRDKSGANRHAAQASETSRPARTPSGLNGRSVVSFDGSDDHLSFTGAARTDETWFVVARANAPAAGVKDHAFIRDNLATGSGFGLNAVTKNDGGTGQVLAALGGFVTGTTRINSAAIPNGSPAGPAIYSLVRSAAAGGSLRVDGVSPLTCTTSNSFALSVIGSLLDGYVAEIVIFDTALSTTNRARVEAYLAAKWGFSNVHVAATATSAPVGAWQDKSGNNRHATQSTAANRPTRAVAANNRNTLLFTGSSTAANAQRLSISNMPVNNNELFTVFAVIRETTATSGIAGRVAIGYRGPTFQYALLSQTFGGVSALYWYHAGATPSFPAPSNVAQLYVVQKTATTTNPISVGLFFNGADTTPTPLSSLGGGGNFGLANFVTSLGSSDGGTNSFTGNICELIAFPRVVSVAERKAVEQYLAGRWGITLAPPAVANVDAQDWVNRVYANGGTVSQSTAVAVNAFCNAIDAAGIRDRFYRLNLFCGNNLNACLVPLYRGPSLSGTQFGNTTDTNTNFLSTDYTERGAVGGLQGNGASKHLLTGLTTAALPQIATGHLSAHITVAGTATGIGGLVTSWMPSFMASNIYYLEINRGGVGNLAASWGNPLSDILYVTPDVLRGHLLVSRTSNTALAAYKNGAQIGSTYTTSITPAANTGNGFAIFADHGDAANNFFSGRMGAYSIGAGLTATQIATFNTILQTFQTTLARNV